MTAVLWYAALTGVLSLVTIAALGAAWWWARKVRDLEDVICDLHEDLTDALADGDEMLSMAEYWRARTGQAESFGVHAATASALVRDSGATQIIEIGEAT